MEEALIVVSFPSLEGEPHRHNEARERSTMRIGHAHPQNFRTRLVTPDFRNKCGSILFNTGQGSVVWSSRTSKGNAINNCIPSALCQVDTMSRASTRNFTNIRIFLARIALLVSLGFMLCLYFLAPTNSSRSTSAAGVLSSPSDARAPPFPIISACSTCACRRIKSLPPFISSECHHSTVGGSDQICTLLTNNYYLTTQQRQPDAKKVGGKSSYDGCFARYTGKQCAGIFGSEGDHSAIRGVPLPEPGSDSSALSSSIFDWPDASLLMVPSKLFDFILKIGMRHALRGFFVAAQIGIDETLETPLPSDSNGNSTTTLATAAITTTPQTPTPCTNYDYNTMPGSPFSLVQPAMGPSSISVVTANAGLSHYEMCFRNDSSTMSPADFWWLPAGGRPTGSFFTEVSFSFPGFTTVSTVFAIFEWTSVLCLQLTYGPLASKIPTPTATATVLINEVSMLGYCPLVLPDPVGVAVIYIGGGYPNNGGTTSVPNNSSTDDPNLRGVAYPASAFQNVSNKTFDYSDAFHGVAFFELQALGLAARARCAPRRLQSTFGHIRMISPFAFWGGGEEEKKKRIGSAIYDTQFREGTTANQYEGSVIGIIAVLFGVGLVLLTIAKLLTGLSTGLYRPPPPSLGKIAKERRRRQNKGKHVGEEKSKPDPLLFPFGPRGDTCTSFSFSFSSPRLHRLRKRLDVLCSTTASSAARSSALSEIVAITCESLVSCDLPTPMKGLLSRASVTASPAVPRNSSPTPGLPLIVEATLKPPQHEWLEGNAEPNTIAYKGNSSAHRQGGHRRQSSMRGQTMMTKRSKSNLAASMRVLALSRGNKATAEASEKEERVALLPAWLAEEVGDGVHHQTKSALFRDIVSIYSSHPPPPSSNRLRAERKNGCDGYDDDNNNNVDDPDVVHLSEIEKEVLLRIVDEVLPIEGFSQTGSNVGITHGLPRPEERNASLLHIPLQQENGADTSHSSFDTSNRSSSSSSAFEVLSFWFGTRKPLNIVLSRLYSGLWWHLLFAVLPGAIFTACQLLVVDETLDVDFNTTLALEYGTASGGSSGMTIVALVKSFVVRARDRGFPLAIGCVGFILFVPMTILLLPLFSRVFVSKSTVPISQYARGNIRLQWKEERRATVMLEFANTSEEAEGGGESHIANPSDQVNSNRNGRANALKPRSERKNPFTAMSASRLLAAVEELVLAFSAFQGDSSLASDQLLEPNGQQLQHPLNPTDLVYSIFLSAHMSLSLWLSGTTAAQNTSTTAANATEEEAEGRRYSVHGDTVAALNSVFYPNRYGRPSPTVGAAAEVPNNVTLISPLAPPSSAPPSPSFSEEAAGRNRESQTHQVEYTDGSLQQPHSHDHHEIPIAVDDGEEKVEKKQRARQEERRAFGGNFRAEQIEYGVFHVAEPFSLWLFSPSVAVLPHSTRRMFGPLVAWRLPNPYLAVYPLLGGAFMGLICGFVTATSVSACLSAYSALAAVFALLAVFVALVRPHRSLIENMGSVAIFVLTGIEFWLSAMLASLGDDPVDFSDPTTLYSSGAGSGGATASTAPPTTTFARIPDVDGFSSASNAGPDEGTKSNLVTALYTIWVVHVILTVIFRIVLPIVLMFLEEPLFVHDVGYLPPPTDSSTRVIAVRSRSQRAKNSRLKVHAGAPAHDNTRNENGMFIESGVDIPVSERAELPADRSARGFDDRNENARRVSQRKIPESREKQRPPPRRDHDKHQSDGFVGAVSDDTANDVTKASNKRRSITTTWGASVSTWANGGEEEVGGENAVPGSLLGEVPSAVAAATEGGWDKAPPDDGEAMRDDGGAKAIREDAFVSPQRRHQSSPPPPPPYPLLRLQRARPSSSSFLSYDSSSSSTEASDLFSDASSTSSSRSPRARDSVVNVIKKSKPNGKNKIHNKKKKGSPRKKRGGGGASGEIHSHKNAGFFEDSGLSLSYVKEKMIEIKLGAPDVVSRKLASSPPQARTSSPLPNSSQSEPQREHNCVGSLLSYFVLRALDSWTCPIVTPICYRVLCDSEQRVYETQRLEMRRSLSNCLFSALLVLKRERLQQLKDEQRRAENEKEAEERLKRERGTQIQSLVENTPESRIHEAEKDDDPMLRIEGIRAVLNDGDASNTVQDPPKEQLDDIAGTPDDDDGYQSHDEDGTAILKLDGVREELEAKDLAWYSPRGNRVDVPPRDDRENSNDPDAPFVNNSAATAIEPKVDGGEPLSPAPIPPPSGESANGNTASSPRTAIKLLPSTSPRGAPDVKGVLADKGDADEKKRRKSRRQSGLQGLDEANGLQIKGRREVRSLTLSDYEKVSPPKPLLLSSSSPMAFDGSLKHLADLPPLRADVIGAGVGGRRMAEAKQGQSPANDTSPNALDITPERRRHRSGQSPQSDSLKQSDHKKKGKHRKNRRSDNNNTNNNDSASALTSFSDEDGDEEQSENEDSLPASHPTDRSLHFRRSRRVIEKRRQGM